MNDNSKLAKPIRNLTSLVRPKYSPGLLLQDDDLTTAVSYTRNLSRLMFRTLFGCGVLCGLKVDPPRMDNCGKLLIDVAKGMALSCAGDPIEVSASQIEIDTCKNELPCFLWVAVRHIESCCVPRTAECSPDDEDAASACTRERDGFEIRVFAERPDCSCGCKKLEPPTQPPTPAVELNAKTAQKSAKSGPQASAMKQSTSSTATVVEASACTDPEKLEAPSEDSADPCLCNLRTADGACYEPFYKGDCACECCDCDWVILAVAARQDSEGRAWKIDHSVRRFVRPVLMRDWLVEEERKSATTGT